MAIELPDGRSESDEVLEALRQRAIHARELDYAVVDIAAILGVREETVSRWCVKYEQGGPDALPGERTGRPPGSGRLLTEQQEDRVIELIDTKVPRFGLPRRRFGEMKTEAVSQLSRRLRDLNREALIQVRW